MEFVVRRRLWFGAVRRGSEEPGCSRSVDRHRGPLLRWQLQRLGSTHCLGSLHRGRPALIQQDAQVKHEQGHSTDIQGEKHRYKCLTAIITHAIFSG